VTFELATGLLALDASREELFDYLNVLRTDLETNSLAAVNAALSVHGESRVASRVFGAGLALYLVMVMRTRGGMSASSHSSQNFGASRPAAGSTSSNDLICSALG
jgi:hypothetical protein